MVVLALVFGGIDCREAFRSGSLIEVIGGHGAPRARYITKTKLRSIGWSLESSYALLAIYICQQCYDGSSTFKIIALENQGSSPSICIRGIMKI